MKKSIFIILTLFCLAVVVSPALAKYTFTTSLPGSDTIVAGKDAGSADGKGSSIVWYVAQLYRVGLAVVGFVAFVAIVYWGIRYTISAGNASKISDAKDGILQAILGIILLLSAYVILRLINPELVNLSCTGTNCPNGLPGLEQRLTDATKQLPTVAGGAFVTSTVPNLTAPPANSPGGIGPSVGCPNGCAPNFVCASNNTCVPDPFMQNGGLVSP